MKLFLTLAWRNAWRHRRRTLIVVLAIGLCMALMMWYDGFVGGFEQAIYSNAVKVLGGNIQVHAAGYREKADTTPLLPLENDQAILDAALAQPQVAAASRRIITSGLATSRQGAFPVSIVGVEPELELPVSLVAQNVTAGRYLKADDLDVAFIGKGLAEAMDVTVGDRIMLAGQALHEQTRTRTMTIIGVYDVGIPEIEKRTVYISLAEAQYLYNLTGQSTEVMISLHRLGQEDAVINNIQLLVTGYEVESWKTNFPELQSALESKGGVMNIFSVIILLISGIGILNLLLMAVFERTREIGILGALGLRPGQISLLFILEGSLMGLLGVIFGVGLGLAINFLLGKIGFDFAQFSSWTEYMALVSGRVYPTLGTEKLALRSLTALIISILASFYPAREASLSEPAEALHYV
ncbi:MAG: ABC transporter permease [Anaerolineae bacterium]|nr:ABC transporter permease [Anaerolineae bacterium]